MEKAFGDKEYISAPALRDFYKCFHAIAAKDGVSEIVTNFTGRSGEHSNIPCGKGYRWAGLQSFINQIIVGEWGKFFAVPVEVAVADYKRVNEAGLGVPCDTSKLESLHKLGYMPLEFRALLEGLEVPYGVAAMTCRTTHPEFSYLAGLIETIQSDEIWPVQTSLTTAVEYFKTIREFAAIDGTPMDLLPFLIHDFSMRGMMGGTMQGGATLSGMGHLMSGLVGSDTMPAALRLELDYDAYLGLDRPFETIASVNATEHYVQCTFNNNDKEYVRHCMKAAPDGILSLVMDGYDFDKFIEEDLPELKDEIMARNGKLVIRHDSADPANVIGGHKVLWQKDMVPETYLPDEIGKGFTAYEHLKEGVMDIHTHEPLSKNVVRGLVVTLHEMFGGTTSEEGYISLDEHIGTIYGDSITLDRQRDIYERLHAKGFAVGNCVLGVGSFTYQYVTRDTHGSAVKATNMILDGVDTPISKEVKGNSVKKSAKGRISVCDDGDGLYQIDEMTDPSNDPSNHHLRVWMDGKWYRKQTLQDVREVVLGSI